MRNRLKKYLLVIALFIPQAIIACDISSAFKPSEFSDRCQRLIDYCQNAYIARLAKHPELEKKISEVSKDWIDFYLSHGNRNVQPPNMSIISPEIWDRNLKSLGVKINDFIRKEIDLKSFQNLILEISLFKSEEKLTKLFSIFKASESSEKDITKIEDYDSWLETRIIQPSRMISEYEYELSDDFVSDLDIIVKDYIESVERFKKIATDPNKSTAAKQSLFNMINKSIDQTLNNWETRFYYK